MRELPETHVLILTTFDLNEYVYEAMKAGASGFLLKDVPRAQLVDGVRTVAAGDALLAPAITRRLIEQFVKRPPSVRPPAAAGDRGADRRELEVLKLVARGRSNGEIAAELFISEATVKTHVAHALAKLDLRDRVQAVVFAYESGLVEPGAGVAAPPAAGDALNHRRSRVSVKINLRAHVQSPRGRRRSAARLP